MTFIRLFWASIITSKEGKVNLTFVFISASLTFYTFRVLRTELSRVRSTANYSLVNMRDSHVIQFFYNTFCFHCPMILQGRGGFFFFAITEHLRDPP